MAIRSLNAATINQTSATVSGLTVAASIVGGTYTVTAADATANSSTIKTGLTSIGAKIVQVLDSGNNVVTSDADVTVSGGNIVVADGSTYNTTAGYIVNYIVIGG
jgi:hypothetical protein